MKGAGAYERASISGDPPCRSSQVSPAVHHILSPREQAPDVAIHAYSERAHEDTGPTRRRRSWILNLVSQRFSSSLNLQANVGRQHFWQNTASLSFQLIDRQHFCASPVLLATTVLPMSQCQLRRSSSRSSKSRAAYRNPAAPHVSAILDAIRRSSLDVHLSAPQMPW